MPDFFFMAIEGTWGNCYFVLANWIQVYFGHFSVSWQIYGAIGTSRNSLWIEKGNFCATETHNVKCVYSYDLSRYIRCLLDFMTF